MSRSGSFVPIGTGSKADNPKPCIDLRPQRTGNMPRERSNMNIVMTGYQERKYGEGGVGAENPSKGKGKKQRENRAPPNKPYYVIMEERAELEKRSEELKTSLQAGSKRRKLANDLESEELNEGYNFERFSFEGGSPGRSWVVHPDDDWCWWFPKRNVVWNEKTGLFHLCDDTGVIAEIDPFFPGHGDHFTCYLRAEAASRKVGKKNAAGAKSSPAEDSGADEEGMCYTKSVIIKDLAAATVGMKKGPVKHLNTPLALNAVFACPKDCLQAPVDYCARSFHAKLIPRFAKYRGAWEFAQFQDALRVICAELHSEIREKFGPQLPKVPGTNRPDYSKCEVHLAATIIHGIRMYCACAGNLVRIYRDQKELLRHSDDTDAKKANRKADAEQYNEEWVADPEDANSEGPDYPLGSYNAPAPVVSVFTDAFENTDTVLMLGVSEEPFDFENIPDGTKQIADTADLVTDEDQNQSSTVIEEKAKTSEPAERVSEIGRDRIRPKLLAMQLIQMEKISMALVSEIRYRATEDETEKKGTKASAEAEGKGKVRVRHLLLKHKDVRNPNLIMDASRVCIPITRTKEEAEREIKGYIEQILEDPEEFTNLIRKHSDCVNTAKKLGGDCGDVGWFTRGKMQKAFEDASFQLAVGEISDIVTSESGIHIIQRRG